jgi:hypothetical protein
VKENFFGVGNCKEGNSQKSNSAANEKSENSEMNMERKETTSADYVNDCKMEHPTEMQEKKSGVHEVECRVDKRSDQSVEEQLTENQTSEFIIDDQAWE